MVEDDGVVIGDCAASRDPLDCEGEAVPSFDSLFFDFDDLLVSFARESCSCWKCQHLLECAERGSRSMNFTPKPRSTRVILTTLCLKPFILSDWLSLARYIVRRSLTIQLVV